MRTFKEEACLICGRDSGRLVCRKGGYEGRLCSCGALYLSPAPPRDAVDPTTDPHPASFYALPAAMKVRWLSQSHPHGRLLEVGCGEGHFLAAASAHGYEVSAIEPHRARSRSVSERLGIEVECALIEDSRATVQSYDVVYHCDLLSHFPDPDLALQRMTGLLRPNGVLFFEVGVYGHISSFWYRHLPESSFPRHRWLFPEEGLCRLLDRCGLRIVRLKRFGLAPQVLVYHGASTLLNYANDLWHRPGDSVLPGDGVTSWRERPLEAWWHNFMRFRVGALAPRWGPQTLFVIAARKEESTH